MLVGQVSIPQRQPAVLSGKTRLFLEATSPPQSVQVCGFKDCKSRGGGARLEKLFHEVRFQLVCV
jgi:hypothetical protein